MARTNTNLHYRLFEVVGPVAHYERRDRITLCPPHASTLEASARLVEAAPTANHGIGGRFLYVDPSARPCEACR